MDHLPTQIQCSGGCRVGHQEGDRKFRFRIQHNFGFIVPGLQKPTRVWIGACAYVAPG